MRFQRGADPTPPAALSTLLSERGAPVERGAAPSDALKIEHVTMQLLPGVSGLDFLKPPGFLNRMVARLRRAPRWLSLLPAHAGCCAETGPSLCRLRLHDLSRPRCSETPPAASSSRERECGENCSSPAPEKVEAGPSLEWHHAVSAPLLTVVWIIMRYGEGTI